MKRGYSASTGPSSGVSGNGAQTSASQHGDENAMPIANHQHHLNALGKPVSTASQGGVPEKEAISKNTRAAIRRHALCDVSNAPPAQQIPAQSAVARAIKGRAVSVKAAIPSSHSQSSTQPDSQVSQVNTKIEQDWDDLDAEDINDPALVVEYVEDIFDYLMSLEKTTMPDPNYMSTQTEITWKMRAVLIDWLVEVHWKLKLLPETLFLAVNLTDRFLSIRSVSLQKLQLVGISATLIAAKYEEILSPCISNFVHLSDGTYDEAEILKAECYMLNCLGFNLSTPNPYVFLRRVSKAESYDVQTRTLAKYFLETALLDPCFLAVPPSMMAAASIFLARKMLNRGEWTANLRHYSRYTAQELTPVGRLFVDFFQKPLKQDAIFKKYSSKRFMKASIFVKDYIAKYYPTAGDAPQ